MNKLVFCFKLKWVLFFIVSANASFSQFNGDSIFSGTIYNMIGPKQGAFDLILNLKLYSYYPASQKDIIEMTDASDAYKDTIHCFFSERFKSGNGAVYTFPKSIVFDSVSFQSVKDSFNVLSTGINYTSNRLQPGDILIIGTKRDSTTYLILFQVTGVFNNSHQYCDSLVEFITSNNDSITFRYKIFETQGIILKTNQDKNYLDLTIYPNPTDGTLHVSNNFEKPFYYFISDITGKVILPANLINAYQNIDIDLRDVSPGIYLLMYYNEITTKNIRIIKY